jgi:hypothetical protein
MGTIQGNQMDYTTTEMNIIYLCFLGFSVTQAWLLGKQKGMNDAIDYFAEQGLIDLDED